MCYVEVRMFYLMEAKINSGHNDHGKKESVHQGRMEADTPWHSTFPSQWEQTNRVVGCPLYLGHEVGILAVVSDYGPRAFQSHRLVDAVRLR